MRDEASDGGRSLSASLNGFSFKLLVLLVLVLPVSIPS